MANDADTTLIHMSDEPITLAEKSMDIRGRKVIDQNDEEIGHVDDLLVDDTERRVRFIRVKAGDFLGLGGKAFLIPIDALTRIGKERVHVDQSKEHVGGGPEYDPEVVVKGVPEYERVYRHYGYAPFWMAGYAYPAFSPMHPAGPELTRDAEPADYQPRD